MKPLRIVIAEDSWFVAEHLRSELAALGHAVVGLARTAEELIELVAGAAGGSGGGDGMA